MNAVILLSGGQGKQLMSANVAMELIMAKKYERYYVCGAYRWWGAMLASEFPNVSEINPQQLPQLAVTIMQNPDEWAWLSDDVYRVGDFILRKKHFQHVLRDLWGLNADSVKLPRVLPDKGFAPAVADTAAKMGRFVIFCRKGGMSNLPNEQGVRNAPTEEVGLLREYPKNASAELVSLFRGRGLRVLQCKLKEEELIGGCEELPQEMPMPFWSMLAERAEGVVTIDSCLMHVTVATAKKMIVIWRETAPGSFGYEAKHIVNLHPKDYKPIAPLMAGFPDSPLCEPASPAEVLSAFFDDKNGKK